MAHYQLIANPAAGGGKARAAALRAARLFELRGASYALAFTERPQHAADLALRAGAAGRTVVVIGGDGTVNETLPALVRTGTVLGIVPAGSGNDLIKSLVIPNDIERAVDIILAGRTAVIDCAAINGRLFVNVAGIGFDAAVNHNSHDLTWPAAGLARYGIALLRTLGAYEKVRLKVILDGDVREEDLFLLTIGNGTTCGGGFRLTPHAKLDDGVLDVTRVRPLRLLPLLWHLPKVLAGTIDRAKRYASMSTARRIRVESSGAVPVHVDGEVYRGDTSMMEIEILPRALAVIGGF
jgi:diacylglycerol kinase (ATP)